MRSLIALFTLLVISPYSYAYAGEQCDSLVYDGAVVLGARVQEVKEAAERLTRQGATVRVRTLKNLEGAATFEEYQQRTQSRCASWQRPEDPKLRNKRLIVLIAVTEEFRPGVLYGSAIFYGYDWKPMLDLEWKSVRILRMNEGFDKNDWAGGMVSGLNEITRLAGGHFVPPAGPTIPPPPPSPAPRPPVASKLPDPGSPPPEPPRETGQDQRVKTANPADNSAGDILYWGLIVLLLTLCGAIILERARRQLRRQNRERANTKLMEASGAIDETNALLTALHAEGFKTTEADVLWLGTHDLMGSAEIAFAENKFGEASMLAEWVRQKAHFAHEAGKKIKSLKAKAESGIEVLAAKITLCEGFLPDCRAAFDRISEKYAPVSWASVEGNGREAGNRIVWAKKTLVGVRELVTMEQQAWEKALEGIEQANGWLNEAETLTSSMIEREKHLAFAEQDAAPELERAVADLARARAFIHQYDQEIKEGLEGELNTSEDALRAAREWLATEKPDYPSLLAQIKEAHQKIDGILVEARSEHEAVDRNRAQLDSAFRDAERAIEKASSYLAIHAGRTSDKAKESLDEARELFEKARGAAHLLTQIELAEEAQKKANGAYSIAHPQVQSSFVSKRSSGGRAWGSNGLPDTDFVVEVASAVVSSNCTSGTSSSCSGGGSSCGGGGGCGGSA